MRGGPESGRRGAPPTAGEGDAKGSLWPASELVWGRAEDGEDEAGAGLGSGGEGRAAAFSCVVSSCRGVCGVSGSAPSHCKVGHVLWVPPNSDVGGRDPPTCARLFRAAEAACTPV
jgi:hypothetical protein